jgi:hypothetical protein
MAVDINVEGKGYYFDSKAEAIAATRRFQAEGRQSIDVGCMQVNLKHHAKAFANLDQAFDPSTNVAYAARFLRDNYAELGDWIKATAAYHSRTQVYGQRYLVQIEKSWNRIVTKVAAARANGGVVTSRPVETKLADTRAVAQPQRKIASTHNVQIIKVTDATPKPAKPDVLVIRASLPETGAEEIASADTQKPFLATVKGDSVRRVALDNAPTNLHGSAAGREASFVFAN